MKLVAATRILDEGDLVEAFVRHTAAHVDHQIILDNGSRDGTGAILRALRDEGLPITLLATDSVSFTESEALTHLFREAATNHAANWVLFLDADEFIDDRHAPGGIRHFLETADRFEAPPLQFRIELVDYVAIVHDIAHELCVPRRIQWREEPRGNYKTIASTRAGIDGIAISPGGHFAYRAANGAALEPQITDARLRHAHFPERSTWQWLAKIVRGWAKVLAAGEDGVERGLGAHYAEAFNLLRDHPDYFFFNERLMGFKNERPGLIHDPIDYRGGELRYTDGVDARIRAARTLMGFVEDLARRHGRLLEHSAEARALSDRWNAPHAL